VESLRKLRKERRHEFKLAREKEALLYEEFVAKVQHEAKAQRASSPKRAFKQPVLAPTDPFGTPRPLTSPNAPSNPADLAVLPTLVERHSSVTIETAEQNTEKWDATRPAVSPREGSEHHSSNPHSPSASGSSRPSASVSTSLFLAPDSPDTPALISLHAPRSP